MNKEEKEEKRVPPHTFKDYIKLILIILAVISLGLLALNQAFAWHYKNYFLKAPCELCISIPENAHLKQCFKEASTYYYTDLEGNLIENITEYERAYWNITLWNITLPT